MVWKFVSLGTWSLTCDGKIKYANLWNVWEQPSACTEWMEKAEFCGNSSLSMKPQRSRCGWCSVCTTRTSSDYESLLLLKKLPLSSWLDTRTLWRGERNSHLDVHPAPANCDVEIADHSAEAPKSRTEQWHGAFVRMAIIEAVLKVAEQNKEQLIIHWKERMRTE